MRKQQHGPQQQRSTQWKPLAHKFWIGLPIHLKRSILFIESVQILLARSEFKRFGLSTAGQHH